MLHFLSSNELLRFVEKFFEPSILEFDYSETVGYH